MKRRLLVPEVVQTSAMDCGPACLSALLIGCGLRGEYGRLREACQTGLDGASIDTIEVLANQMGLEAEQVVVPAEHLAIPEAGNLPAVAVVRLPDGVTHFVVVWRVHGGRLQLMDPATGRRFTPVDAFVKELYVHEMMVPATAWREWAGSGEFVEVLRARMRRLGVGVEEIAGAVENALAHPGWRPLATLDAAVRMLQAIVNSGALSSDVKRATLFRTLLRRDSAIPEQYWSVRPESGESERVVVRGAVLVRVKRCRSAEVDVDALPAAIAAAVSGEPLRPLAAVWKLVRPDGLLPPAAIILALFFSALGLVLQAFLFRGFFAGTSGQGEGGGLATVAGATVALLCILLAIDIPAISLLTGMGRRLETRFRAAFLEKLPRIPDAYLNSRLHSDMAERSHSVQNLRVLPGIAGQLLHTLFQLVLSTAALILLDPGLWWVATLLTLAAAGLPIAMQPLLAERELRMRTFGGALSRFYFDALFGLVPIRTHVGAPALRGEHRNLLKKWARAGLDTQKLSILLNGVQMFAAMGLGALLAILYVSRHGAASALLLVVYWSVTIPNLGRDLSALVCQYPAQRNTALRLLEPLHAPQPELRHPEALSVVPGSYAPSSGAGVHLAMRNVSMKAGGHIVLHDLSVEIASGSHVAIVGASGAGKSSFLGLLLGWNNPEAGSLLVDGQPLSEAGISKLRRHAVWVDPNVQLWNRSLVDNLRFSVAGEPAMDLGQALEEASLTDVLEKLPDGLESKLGESGALVSGGEGQRIRIGRALLRSDVRLAVLDEPFRGLDAGARRTLLRRARHAWRNATLLFASHEIRETQSFPRVLVIENGAIVEDGRPAELLQRPGSRYAALLRRETELRRELLDDPLWRRVEMRDGVLKEEEEPGVIVLRLPGKEKIA